MVRSRGDVNIIGNSIVTAGAWEAELLNVSIMRVFAQVKMVTCLPPSHGDGTRSIQCTLRQFCTYRVIPVARSAIVLILLTQASSDQNITLGTMCFKMVVARSRDLEVGVVYRKP